MNLHQSNTLVLIISRNFYVVNTHSITGFVLDNVRQFWIQDNHFLSQVESSRWLHTVSACLGKATKAAAFLQDNVTVVLQEADGRDLSCVISSLTQLLVDVHFRSILGFQTLLQKEWVAMGHPFCSRLGHILNSEIQQVTKKN